MTRISPFIVIHRRRRFLDGDRGPRKGPGPAVTARPAASSRPCDDDGTLRGRRWSDTRHCRRRDACAPPFRRRTVHGGRRRPRGGSAGSGGGEGGCLLRWNYPLTTGRPRPFSPSASHPRRATCTRYNSARSIVWCARDRRSRVETDVAVVLLVPRGGFARRTCHDSPRTFSFSMECPEAVERGRNFRLLAEEELSQLLDFLTGYLPESLKFHQTVLTYMRDRVWEFHFYVANDWPDEAICLHFPGMTLSPHGLLYESVGVFCPNDRLELLRLLREEDILVDWSKPLYINFVHYDIAEELMRLYEGTGTVETVVGDVCACEDFEQEEGSEGPGDESDPDVQVLPLKAEHAEGIHELYPANDMECHELFLRLIRTLPAAGVFAKGRLAAWMVQSYYGAMFSMQTKPEYRRKGYGTKLARYLTKRVAEKGYYPFVVIRPENEASQSLYKKLGFRRLYQIVRMIFTPSMWQDSENDTNILRDNLENAVRQLTIEQRVITALRDQEESERTIRDPSGVTEDESIVEKSDGGEEGEEDASEEVLETIEEHPEERINVANDTATEDASQVTDCCDCDCNCGMEDAADGGE